jgi:hypothetical protein
MPLFTKYGFSSNSGSFVIAVGFGENPIPNTRFVELPRRIVKLLLALDTKDDKMGVF